MPHPWSTADLGPTPSPQEKIMSDYLRERVNPAMPSYLDVWEAAEYLSLPLSPSGGSSRRD
jgi:hypothetical protein